MERKELVSLPAKSSTEDLGRIDLTTGGKAVMTEDPVCRLAIAIMAMRSVDAIALASPVEIVLASMASDGKARTGPN